MRKLFYLLALFSVLGTGKIWAQSWDFKKELSATDVTNLNADTENWETDNSSRYKSKTTINGALTANGQELEITKGIEFGNANTGKLLIKPQDYVRPDAKDITLTFSNVAADRIIKINYKSASSSSERGFTVDNSTTATVGTTENLTTTGTAVNAIIPVATAGNVVLNVTGGGIQIYTIDIEEKPSPELNFNYGTNCSAQIPYDETSTTIFNALNGVPTGSTVTWSIADAGTTGATVSNSSGTQGYVTVSNTGTCIVRATTSATASYASAYAEYTLAVTKGAAPVSGYEYTVTFNNGATQTPSGSEYFTVVGASYQSTYNGTYDGVTYTAASKVDSKFATSFTVSGTATVTIVQCISRSGETEPLTFDGTALSGGITNSADGYVEYTLTDVAAGTHEIKRGQSQTGIFFIKVVDSAQPKTHLTQFAFNADEVVLHNGTSSYIYVNGKEFVYDGTNRTLRAKLIMQPDYERLNGVTLTSTYFTVESSNPSVLNTSGATFRKASDQRLYVDDIAMGEVTSDQEVTLTFHFLGNDDYAPADIEVPLTIKAHNPTLYTSQPHIWDFTGNWDTSKLQVNYGYSIWTVTGNNEARPTSATVVNANNGIDMIQGLAFTTTSASDLCLDWTNKQLWLNTDATIAIPGLSVGQTVTITTTNGNNFAIAGDGTATGTMAGNVITVTTAGTLKVRMTAGTYIKSIAVANAITAPYKGIYSSVTTALWDDEDDNATDRPTTGTWTFTEAGSIAGGTVINEVPGLSVTIGKAGEDTWSVVSATTLDGSYNLGAAALYCSTQGNTRPAATSGQFIDFTPTVNGTIEIRYYSSVDLYVYENRKDECAHNSQNRIQSISFHVVAGKTYTVQAKNGLFYLGSYSFTPQFFDPLANNAYQSKYTTNIVIASHDEDAPFVATSDTPANMYPKMIVSDSQAGTVRFAGNKSVVYLYNNNNVELLGYSDYTIIRGRVYAPAPNDDRQLNAWYYLRSNVLQLSSTQLNSTAITDKEYISNPGGSSNNYVFTFNQAITLDAQAQVSVRKDAADAQTVTATVSGANLTVPLGTLEEGSTYTITVKAGSVDSNSDNAVTSAEITRIFTVKNNGELSLDMIYPSGIATVGTRIVLKSKLMDDDSKEVNIANDYPALDKNDPDYNDDRKGKLVGDLYKIVNGEEVFVEEIIATYATDKLSFRPAQILDTNSTYTLKVSAHLDHNPPYQVKGTVDGSVYYVKHDKAFTFKTGTVSGTAPIMSASTPYDGQRCTLNEMNVDAGTFTVTFDQNIDLEDGTIISIKPVNGSEDTTTGYFYKLTDEFYTDKPITVSGNTLTVTGGNEGLRYDLWHVITIPAGTVVGTGGTPNTTDITIKFKVDKNEHADQVVTYPYTWDFSRISAQSTNTTIADVEANSTFWQKNKSYFGAGDDKYKNALKKGTEDGCTTYKSDNSNNGRYDQGNNMYVVNSTNGDKIYLKEFYGLRISLKKSQNPRFEIRDLTSGNSNDVNADGSHKYVFRMNGNTHYLTIPDLPKGEFYMSLNAGYLGINSPNAYIDLEQNGNKITTHKTYNGDATKAEVIQTNGNTSIKIVVTQAGDVSFCVKNFNLNQIAVPIVTDKQISAVGYATDSWSVPVRYDLTNTLTGNDVTGMFIKSSDDEGKAYDTNSTKVYLTPVRSTLNGELKAQGPKVATAGAGTILKGAAGSYALFTADVNSLPDNTMNEGDSPNLLVGNSDNAVIIGNSAGTSNDYIFSNVYYNVDKDGNITDGIEHQGLGFKLVAAGLSVADRTLAPHKSYLHLPTGATTVDEGAARVSLLLLDFENNVLNAIHDIPTTDSTNIASEGDDPYYTLSGMRVSRPTQKGIYIKNGKKYYVK